MYLWIQLNVLTSFQKRQKCTGASPASRAAKKKKKKNALAHSYLKKKGTPPLVNYVAPAAKHGLRQRCQI